MPMPRATATGMPTPSPTFAPVVKLPEEPSLLPGFAGGDTGGDEVPAGIDVGTRALPVLKAIVALVEVVVDCESVVSFDVILK